MAKNPKPSLLDPGQIIKRVFDDDNDEIRVNASISMGNTTQEVVISQTDDSIAIGDGSTLYSGTTIGSDYGLDVNIIGGVVSGNFTSSGLTTGLQSYVVTVTDSPTAIPVISGQNGVSIRVWGASTVYFGNSSVGSNNGYPKKQYEEIVLDIKDVTAVRIYGVCSAGQTCDVRVLAIA